MSRREELRRRRGDKIKARFTIEPAVFAYFPRLHLPVAVAYGLDNHRSNPGVDALLTAAWAAVRTHYPYPNAQSHPRVRHWRDCFSAMGVSGKRFPSSVEALLRRALKDPQPLRINPLVDAYNAVSLRHAVPAGAFDLGAVTGNLILRMTQAGETFQALGSDTAETVEAGEVAYADGATLLTRHFVWRQSERAKITADTADAFLIAEVLGEVGVDVALAVLQDFRELLQVHFGVEAHTFLVNADRPAVAW